MLWHLLQALFSLQLASAVLPIGDPPSIVVSPQHQTVVAGRVAVFVCTAVGNPSPQIQWRKNGKRIFSMRYTMVTNITGGSVLRINAVRSRREDSTYECLAENGVGVPARAQFTLTVLEGYQIPPGFPHFKLVPNPQGVERYRSALLSCKAEGDPEPSLSWLRNYIPVDMSNPRYSLTAEGSLQISDAQEEDQGNYECIAENSVGTAISPMATLFVRVRRVPPKFEVLPESTYEVSHGAPLNLTCVAVGSPMPFVLWHKGHVRLTADSELPVGRNVLVLENVRESANYTCLATSMLGSIEHVSQVLVREDGNQSQIPTYSQVRDSGADLDNRTDQNVTAPARSDSVALNAAALASLAPAVNEEDHVPAVSETTPGETAVLRGRLCSPQSSLAGEADVRIALLREEHALRVRLIQEDHDDILKKRDEEHNLKMEILRRQKVIQDFAMSRLLEGK